MSKSVRQRVIDSFPSDAPTDDAKEYSTNVYAAWKDVSSSLSRSALLAYILMAFFELIIYQHASTVISIGTFALANAPIAQIVLPAIVAYIAYDGFRLSVRWFNLQRAYATLTKIYAPKQFDNGLYVIVRPSLPSLWAIGSWGSPGIATTSIRFTYEANRVVSYIMMFAVPIIFECQAYYRLIQEFGYLNILLWISLVLTVLLAGLSAVVVWPEIHRQQQDES